MRRWVSALLVGLAAWVAATALWPDEPPRGEPVVVASRDLPAGHRLVPADLRIDRWPADIRPSTGYAHRDDAVGSTLSGPVAEGEAVTTGRTRGAALLAQLPAGRVMVHIPVADGGLARVLRPGDRLDAISTADGSVLGADLLVLAAGTGGADDAGWSGAGVGPLTSGDAGAGPGVLVATSPGVASRLAASRGAPNPGGGVMLTVHRPGE